MKRVYGEKIEIRPESVSGFYGERAKRFDELGLSAVLLGDQDPGIAQKVNEFEKIYILPRLGIKQDSRVLDIGCGVGRWGKLLDSMCDYYCGTDFSAGMIEQARKYCNGANCQFFNLSFQQINKIQGKFDVAIVAGVCMYVNDSELLGAFSNLVPLLDDNCTLYLKESVAVKERLTLNEFPSDALKADYNVIYRTLQEYNEVYKILTGNGFKITEQDYLPVLNNQSTKSETGRWYTIMKR